MSSLHTPVAGLDAIVEAVGKPYFRDDAVAVYHADCRDILSLTPPESVDLVFADPPFSVPVKYHDSSDNHPRSFGDLQVMEPFFREVFGPLSQAVKRSGQTYICCDGESYLVFFRATYSLWPESHLLIWYKPTGRRGRGWLHAHELILHLRTPGTIYAGGFRQDVVGIMPVRTLNRQHPAEKPRDLVEFLLEASPAQIILDPFMGSGTTLRAAKDLGRYAIGIEIEEKYCEIAAKRMAQMVMPLEAP